MSSQITYKTLKVGAQNLKFLRHPRVLSSTAVERSWYPPGGQQMLDMLAHTTAWDQNQGCDEGQPNIFYLFNFANIFSFSCLFICYLQIFHQSLYCLHYCNVGFFSHESRKCLCIFFSFKPQSYMSLKSCKMCEKPWKRKFSNTV